MQDYSETQNLHPFQGFYYNLNIIRMIMITIVGVILLLSAISITAYYFHERDDITQRQEESIQRQNVRVNESLDVELNMDTAQITIDNIRGTPSKINGIMLECDDGSKHVVELDIEVDSEHAGASTQMLCDKMKKLLVDSKCFDEDDPLDPGHRVNNYLNRVC